MVVAACSFCGKKRSEVQKLLAATNAMICGECVQYCIEIIARDRTSSGSGDWLRETKRLVDKLSAQLMSSPKIHG